MIQDNFPSSYFRKLMPRQSLTQDAVFQLSKASLVADREMAEAAVYTATITRDREQDIFCEKNNLYSSAAVVAASIAEYSPRRFSLHEILRRMHALRNFCETAPSDEQKASYFIERTPSSVFGQKTPLPVSRNFPCLERQPSETFSWKYSLYRDARVTKLYCNSLEVFCIKNVTFYNCLLRD